MRYPRKYMKRGELAARWGITVRGLEDRAARGEPPAVHNLGPRTRCYLIQEIEEIERKAAEHDD